MKSIKRRAFIKGSALLTAGLSTAPLFNLEAKPKAEDGSNLYLLGPQEGYSPHIGSLLSTMTMMREWMTRTAKGLTVEELDYQIDDQSNSIGAMLFHLAATERYYQINTFDEIPFGKFSDEIRAEWDVAMNLGEEGRKKIVGNELDFYLEKLYNVREVTKAEFAKRDDEWLFKSEPFFGDQPTNNYAKWFHVCEHESNHNGQMKFIRKRLPKK